VNLPGRVIMVEYIIMIYYKREPASRLVDE
jgi:hypothetical protein